MQVAHGVDCRFRRIPRRGQHDELAKCRRLCGRASTCPAAEPTHHRLRLVGRWMPDAEENLMAGFLRPGGSERPADVASANNAKFHLLISQNSRYVSTST